MCPDISYGTVLQDRRKALHERTAQAMEALYRTSLEDHYSELSHHYGRSGNTEKAVEYLGLMGQQAIQRSANEEAIRYLTTALELVKTLPDTNERAQQELALQITLGVPVMATYGWTATQVEAVYTRARELCRQIGETPQLCPTLWALSYLYSMRAEYQTAQELGEQCLSIAQRSNDAALLIEAHYILGVTLIVRGEFVTAREHFEQTIALYNPQQHAALAHTYAEQDAGVFCRADVGWVLWYLGYPDQAIRKLHEAEVLAQELAQRFSLGFKLLQAGSVHYLRGEPKAALEQTEASITLSTEHGFFSTRTIGTFWHGCALAELGQEEEGIAQMQEGMTAYRAAGGRGACWSFWLAQLARVYGKGGQIEDGLRTVAEALDFVTETGERLSEAELYRLKGELLLQKAVGRNQKAESEVQKEAEECFQQAINIARHQEAKSWELRAATSMARLWQQQGKKAEARELLAEVYSWFTEGFDTKDLQEAEALLEELEGE